MKPILMVMVTAALIAGCKPQGEAAGGNRTSAVPQEVGQGPICGGDNLASPECGGGDPPEVPDQPDPPPPPEHPDKPDKPAKPGDPRGEVLAVDSCGFQCVRVRVRCTNGRTGAASAANGNEARDQAFRECED